MLLTSTSEVYGDPEVHPQKESYWGHVNPIGPRACYDEGKRVAETMMSVNMHIYTYIVHLFKINIYIIHTYIHIYLLHPCTVFVL